MSNWFHYNIDGSEYVKTVEHNNEKDIEDILIGRKVVDVEGNAILVLDNGMKLLVEPNRGCGGCESGWYNIEHITSCNNVITNVEFDCYDEEDKRSYYTNCTHYKIFVIADGIRTELLDVYGTDGNGYYGTGYSIDVYVPDEQSKLISTL